MKKTAFLALGTMLVAGAALASNTGFKLNYPITYVNSRNTNTNWMSFPLFYFPNGNVSVSSQNSIDICADLNDFACTAGTCPKAAQVIQWRIATQQGQVQNCTNTTKVAFQLTPGEAYAVVPALSAPGNVVVNVVGSNNDTYAPNKNGLARYPVTYVNARNSNTNWVSVPYHTLANNSIDLCSQFNAQTGNLIGQVTQWRIATQQGQVQNCTNTTKVAFTVTPGEAYAVVPLQTTAIGWDVY